MQGIIKVQTPEERGYGGRWVGGAMGIIGRGVCETGLGRGGEGGGHSKLRLFRSRLRCGG